MDGSPPATARRGPYPKSVETRAAILDRATELIGEHGPEHVSLRMIAESLGMSHPALTYYFSSRDELLLAVLDESERRALEQNDTVRTVPRMRRSSRRNEETPGTIQLYLSLAARALNDDGIVREHITARFERVRARFEQRIITDQAAGSVRSDLDASAIAALLVAAMDGLQLQHLLAPDVDQDAALAILEELLPPADAAVRP
ncbi:MAG TPA: TetR/AcrR family transcriptional regulator [Pseudolysinimonas sp.]|nr:TetR/AcrR family transcriptional regulator [Pseudolysinimonas sp.]